MSNPINQLIEEALPEVVALMAQRFAEVGGVPEPGSDLDQNGLRDGEDAIRDLMAHNESGIVLEHLCYMVEETNLPISAKTYAVITTARQESQMPPWKWRSASSDFEHRAEASS